MNTRNIQKSIEHLESARKHHIARSIYHAKQVDYVEFEIVRLTKEVNGDEVVFDTSVENVVAIE